MGKYQISNSRSKAPGPTLREQEDVLHFISAEGIDTAAITYR